MSYGAGMDERLVNYRGTPPRLSHPPNNPTAIYSNRTQGQLAGSHTGLEFTLSHVNPSQMTAEWMHRSHQLVAHQQAQQVSHSPTDKHMYYTNFVKTLFKRFLTWTNNIILSYSLDVPHVDEPYRSPSPLPAGILPGTGWRSPSSAVHGTA